MKEKFIDKLEKALIVFGEDIKGVRNYNINDYILDYYIPALNVAIEYKNVDICESINFSFKGIDCIQEFEKKLKCCVIRVSQNKSHEYNIAYIIKSILEMCSNQCLKCGCNNQLFNGEYICGNCGNSKAYEPCYPF